MGKFTYLLLDCSAIFIPLLASFHPKLGFSKRLKYFLPSMLITAIVFLLWDEYFTRIGVWGFNSRYLVGLDIGQLPLEELLFFVCIPFACVFTYDSLRLVISDKKRSWSTFLSYAISISLLGVAIFNIEKVYTAVTFLSLSVFLFVCQKIVLSKKMGRVFIMYAFILIPFFLINGVLTGSWIEGEVVWYNNMENLGIRMGTIPIEDTFYGLLLILMNIAGYEMFMSRPKKTYSPSGAR